MSIAEVKHPQIFEQNTCFLFHKHSYLNFGDGTTLYARIKVADSELIANLEMPRTYCKHLAYLVIRKA